jgi:hypothetical protein
VFRLGDGIGWVALAIRRQTGSEKSEASDVSSVSVQCRRFTPKNI